MNEKKMAEWKLKRENENIKKWKEKKKRIYFHSFIEYPFKGSLHNSYSIIFLFIFG